MEDVRAEEEEKSASLESETLPLNQIPLPSALMRLEHLSCKNYRGIDTLELGFPQPRHSFDLDMLVLGSENGMGKTSVLEACALTYWLAMAGPEFRLQALHQFRRYPLDEWTPRQLVRAGATEAKLDARLKIQNASSSGISGDTQVNIALRLRVFNRPMGEDYDVFGKVLPELKSDFSQERIELARAAKEEGFLGSMLSIQVDPVLLPRLLYFNSHRRVGIQRPSLDHMSGPPTSPRGMESMSAFKRLLLAIDMARGGLFDVPSAHLFEGAKEKLEELLYAFTGLTFAKLRALSGNRVDFQVQRSSGETFSFDGLSSGQKEIISTLFLIWFHTRNMPSLVLIDEPELHLNERWHRELMVQLSKLAPQNQYVIATHSERIFQYAPEEQRCFLTP